MNKYLIRELAKQYGWSLIVTDRANHLIYYDFIKQTSGGITFCFTAEMKVDNLKFLIDDILDFIDVFDPESYADEWLDKSVKIDSAYYLRVVTEMDDIRSSAWLFVYDLMYEYEMEQKLTDFPGWLWN